MEPAEAFENKVKNFEKALDSFGKLLFYDLSLFNEVVTDGLKNGRIQKFEYCSEICWKLIKRFLFNHDGIEVNSPKTTVKEFYNSSHITESEYEILTNMIDDKTRLSHVYKEEFFEEISMHLPEYYEIMRKVLEVLKTKSM